MESRNRLAELLVKSRYEAGKSQEAVATALGVARKTVQNWEKGFSAPSFEQTMQWLGCLGIATWPYLLQYVYPCMEGISGKDDDKRIREALQVIIAEMPPEAVRQLMYLFYGDHGSSPRAILHLVNAHLQTPMHDRVSQAGVIIHNYELAKLKGQLTSNDHIQPDMDLLTRALEAGEEAVVHDRQAYVLNEDK